MKLITNWLYFYSLISTSLHGKVKYDWNSDATWVDDSFLLLVFDLALLSIRRTPSVPGQQEIGEAVNSPPCICHLLRNQHSKCHPRSLQLLSHCLYTPTLLFFFTTMTRSILSQLSPLWFIAGRAAGMNRGYRNGNVLAPPPRLSSRLLSLCTRLILLKRSNHLHGCILVQVPQALLHTIYTFFVSQDFYYVLTRKALISRKIFT